jgi:hypothetical protein
MRQATLFLLLFGSVLGCMAQESSIPNAVQISVQDYAVRTFLYSRTSGSLILTGKCVQSPYGDAVSTDELKIQAPDLQTNQNNSLTRLMQAYPAVTWSRQGNGMVQIRDNRALAAILELPIQRFELKDAVSLEDALRKLLLAPEVKEFLTRTHMQMPAVVSSSTFSNEEVDRKLSQSSTAPKYSRIITDVTFGEALDSLIRVFPGVWIYNECPGRITITANPTGVPDWKKIQLAGGTGSAN